MPLKMKHHNQTTDSHQDPVLNSLPRYIFFKSANGNSPPTKATKTKHITRINQPKTKL